MPKNADKQRSGTGQNMGMGGLKSVHRVADGGKMSVRPPDASGTGLSGKVKVPTSELFSGVNQVTLDTSDKNRKSPNEGNR